VISNFLEYANFLSGILLWHIDSIVLGISVILLVFEKKKGLFLKININCRLTKEGHLSANRKFGARKGKRLCKMNLHLRVILITSTFG